MGAQTVAILDGELAAEEAADQKPEMMLPVVELLQPGALVDALFGTKRGSIVEAVQVGEAGEEFCRVLHAVNAELQLIDILRVEMDGGFLGGREAAVGAQIEGDRRGGMQMRGKQQPEQEKQLDAQSPSRKMFQR